MATHLAGRWSRLMLAAVTALLVAGQTSVGSAAAQPLETEPAGHRAPYAAGDVPRPCTLVRPFRATDFSTPTSITNRWLPLVPGTRFVLAGDVEGEAHEVVFTVTDLTKLINGVRTLIVLDRDFSDGSLVESELAFFAQDDRGNVWNVGEYPEEYEDGELLGAPDTWIAGLDDAVPGLAMRASPALGTGWYLQGWVEPIEFLDCAKVFKLGQRACAAVACYSDLLVIDERSPLDPTGGSQRKFYAAGVGNVKITAVGGKDGETLTLAEYRRLGAAEMNVVRAAALAMDRRGHSISDVYGETSLAEH